MRVEIPDRTRKVIQRAETHLLQNYRQQPMVVERGLGTRVWDVEGRSYLDLLGGIATCALGHCHPEVVAAVKVQLDKLWHASNVFFTLPQIELAERLTAAAGLERAFFCNSGAEANEALLKLARRVQKDRGHPERFELICFEGSFHGRTLATVAATGQPKYQQGFEPLPAGFLHVPYGDLEAVRRAVSPKTAAIMVEPIQGEGGVRVAPEGFLRSLRSLCDEEGLLLLVDEVQTGMGRTGKWYAFQNWSIEPDVVTLAKAIAGGIACGGLLAKPQFAAKLVPGTHAATFGGNPIACRAALATIETIAADKLLERAVQIADGFRQRFEALKSRCRLIQQIRILGCMIGVELATDGTPIVDLCLKKRLLVNCTHGNVVRLLPAMNLTDAQLNEGCDIIDEVLMNAQGK